MPALTIRRKLRSFDLRIREARMFAKAMRSPRHPVLAHIIPIRRCNLSCAYCNEYDAVSKPVPLEEMLRRVDLLARLGTTIITISGGEPLLHPDLDEIIRRIRSHGVIATLITNGYLLTRERIGRLNRAGLDYLQISIDNLQPDEVSKKSLQVLDRKLRWLAEHAQFRVNINSVLGSSLRNPADTGVLVRRARELGFSSTVGVVHNHSGQLVPLNAGQQRAYEEAARAETSLFSFAQYQRFQKNLARGLPNRWHCRAGGRYLYICEDGLVHWCSQQRGYPAIPLERYSQEDLDRESRAAKPCAPLCTISCVHQTAMLDAFRENPHGMLAELVAARREAAPGFSPPLALRLFSWMFLHSSHRRLFERAALWFLRVRAN